MSSEPVVLGRFGSCFGVKGYIKLRSFTQRPESLFDYKPWFVKAADGSWRELTIEDWRSHQDGFVAKPQGISSPEEAREYSGRDVGILRESLPEPEDGEFYITDLVGFTVTGADDSALGVVSGIRTDGATPLMVLEHEERGGKKQPLCLIPYVPDAIVTEVSFEKRLVKVTWTADYLS